MCVDENLKRFLCEDVVREFCNMCIRDVVQEDFMCDTQRQEQLVDLGYKIGKGDGHNCNCLIDSLLQLLPSPLPILYPKSTNCSCL